MSIEAIGIISFGYGHLEPPPAATMTYDLRHLLRNPHHDPAMRQATGLDQAVYDHVRNTPGAEHLAVNAAATARHLAEDTHAPVTVAFGCVGGRHRSVVLALRVHTLLHAAGVAAWIEHRDVAKDVLPTSAHSVETALDEARAAVAGRAHVSLSWLQRTLRLPHDRAVTIADRLEAEGRIGPWREQEKQAALEQYAAADRALAAVEAGQQVAGLSGSSDARGVAYAWYRAAKRAGATQQELRAASHRGDAELPPGAHPSLEST